VSTVPKPGAKSLATHPVRPPAERVDLVDAYKRIAKRFPKVMAELAK
jgi:hypothetical protein